MIINRNIKIIATNEDNLSIISAVKLKSVKHTYKNILSENYLDSFSQLRIEEKITGIHREEGREYFLVTYNNSNIGMLSITTVTKFNSSKGIIHDFYLLPEMKNKGLGSKVLQLVNKEFKKNNITKIIVYVLEENNKARKFFKKNGFIFTHSDKYEISSGELISLDYFQLMLEQ